MAETPMRTAHTRLPLADPHRMLHRLCEHFAAHGTVTATTTCGRIETQFGHAALALETGALRIEAAGANATALHVVKMSLAEHVFLLAEEEIRPFAWSGDDTGAGGIPFFREMTVRGARNITPLMRRVTLAGEDVAHFETGGLHVRVLIPPAGREPCWPTAATDGRTLWPRGEDELTARVYTIRRIDQARGEVDIDVVLHGDGSPGSRWASTAAPGERIGLMGPGGGEIAKAGRYVLAGDETALPAIARIAESLPAGARAVALIEVADAAEEQSFASAARIETRWLHRNGAAPGTTRLLETALRGLDWSDTGDIHAFVGCEHAAARGIRNFLHKERAMAKSNSLIAAYWRRGHDGAGGQAGD